MKDKIFDIIYNGNYYEIDPPIIKELFKFKGISQEGIENGHYTTILKNKDKIEKLVLYLENNISEYVEKILLQAKNDNESSKAIEKILNNPDVKYENKKTLLELQKNLFEVNIEDMDEEEANLLFETKKIKPTWEILMFYVEKFENDELFSEEIFFEYLQSNGMVLLLEKLEESVEKEETIRKLKEIIMYSKEISFEIYKNFLEKFTVNFIPEWGKVPNEEKISVVIDRLEEIQNLENIESLEICKLLFEKNKIKITWENLIIYYKKNDSELKNESELDERLIQVFNKKNIYDSLSDVNIDKSEDLDKIVKWIYYNDKISDKAFEKLVLKFKFKWNYGIDFTKMKEQRIKKLIEFGKLTRSQENIDELKKLNLECWIDLYLINDENKRSEINISEFSAEDILKILNVKNMNLDNKIEIVTKITSEHLKNIKLMNKIKNIVNDENINLMKVNEELSDTIIFEVFCKNISEEIKKIVSDLKKYIISFGDDIVENIRKNYIVYKKINNIVCIIPKNKNILLYLNLNPDEVEMIEGLTENVKGIGHHGTGDLKIIINNGEDFEKVKGFIELAFNK